MNLASVRVLLLAALAFACFAGCQSVGEPESQSHASLRITWPSLLEIQRSIEKVFGEQGFKLEKHIGEEWVFEAATDTYLPLLCALRDLADEDEVPLPVEDADAASGEIGGVDRAARQVSALERAEHEVAVRGTRRERPDDAEVVVAVAHLHRQRDELAHALDADRESLGLGAGADVHPAVRGRMPAALGVVELGRGLPHIGRDGERCDQRRCSDEERESHLDLPRDGAPIGATTRESLPRAGAGRRVDRLFRRRATAGSSA